MSDENPLSIDVSEDINKLLEHSVDGPLTWRDGHQLVDLGQGRPYALIEHKVRLIDADDVCAALNGTCHAAHEIAEDWEVPEEVILKLAGEADIERCETCSWWCDISETEIVDDEPICLDCQENP